MVVICVSDIPKWLMKASFYEPLQTFEDFCYYLDKSFKKTYKVKYVNTSNLTIDDNIQEKFPELTEQEIKQVESIINCKHGTKTEKQYIPSECKSQVQFRKKINDSITLSGRVDYIEDNIIYEIKSRRNKLFKQLYESEKIQIQLYMYMSGIHEAILQENYKDDIFEIPVTYDEEFCLQVIDEFIAYYNRVMEFLENREAYYTTGDKLAFIKNLKS